MAFMCGNKPPKVFRAHDGRNCDHCDNYSYETEYIKERDLRLCQKCLDRMDAVADVEMKYNDKEEE